MMEFTIEEAASGEFRVVQTRPVLIGTFPERAVAERFMSFLIEDALDALDAAPAAPVEPPEPGEAPAPPDHAPVAPAPASPEAWTEDEVAEAFVRIAGGEKLSVVARSFGKNWTSLRGKWANHKRVEQAPTAIEADMEECRMCGKVFMQTATRLDLCARCDR